MYTIVGLGNPGEEYALTRHNTGRMVMEALRKRGVKAKFIDTGTFMNKSGSAVAKAIKSKSAAKKLIVIYDDLDLPLGTMKLSYDRSSGGHKGLESIIRALKTKEFIRLRIGIGKPARTTVRSGGKEPVEKHILGKFAPRELAELEHVFKKAGDAAETLIEHGLPRAMSEFNK